MIYADVLVAINYFVSYAMLKACSRFAGIPLDRRGTVRGSLVGGLSALAVFLPLEGFVWGLLLRLLSAAAMLLAAWPGRSREDYLRMGAILLCISFLFAGAVMGWCLLFPGSPVSCPGGMVYFHVTPLVLLLSVTGAYLLLGVVRRFWGRKTHTKRFYHALICRKNHSADLYLLSDSGNTLTEPFSGLPVMVCGLQMVGSLLSPEEKAWFDRGAPPEELPLGMRLVAYQAVGGSGMLGAFRPEKIVLSIDEKSWDCLSWVAVNMKDMPGCDGVFNPDMLELRI